jgi:hypothetical protein
MARGITRVLGTGSVLPPTGGRPGPSNTGAVGTLDPLSGNQTITTPNYVLENKDISGDVRIRAAGVTVRNCIVRGSATSVALVDCGNEAVVGATLTNLTLLPTYPTYNLNGVTGHDFSATGLNISGVVDGFGLWSQIVVNTLLNVSIYGCWVHDVHCSTAPYLDGFTHNDGIQVHGQGGIIVRNNNFTLNPGPTSGAGLGATTGFLATGGIAPAIDMVIEDNYFDYAGAQIQIANGDSGETSTTALIRNNRFGRNGKLTGVAPTAVMILDTDLDFVGMPTTTGPDTQGNVYDDNDAPVSVKRWKVLP